MKKIAIVVSVLFAFSAPVLAGPKDKSSQTMIDIDAAGIIDNNLSKTKVASKGCTLQVQLKDTTLLNGEVVICLASADIRSTINGGNSMVITGEAKNGQLKIKADLSELVFAGNSCGSVVADQFNGSLECYLDDQTYRTSGVPGNWQAACVGGGSGVNTNADPKTLKTALDGNGNPQKVVVGLCQGAVDGFRINPPPTQRFALTGGRVQIQ